MLYYFLYLGKDGSPHLPYEQDKLKMLCDIFQAVYFIRQTILIYNPDSLAELEENEEEYEEYPPFKGEKNRLLKELQEEGLAEETSVGEEDLEGITSFYLDYNGAEQPLDDDLSLAIYYAVQEKYQNLRIITPQGLSNISQSPINTVFCKNDSRIPKAVIYQSTILDFIKNLIENRVLTYEANYKKHPCTNANGRQNGGEWISNQKQPCHTMQEILNIALCSGIQMYAYDEGLGEYVEFKITNNSIWHGYHLDAVREDKRPEVPREASAFIDTHWAMLLGCQPNQSRFVSCISTTCGQR